MFSFPLGMEFLEDTVTLFEEMPNCVPKQYQYFTSLPPSPHPCQYLLLSMLLTMAILVHVEWYLVVLVCISLIAKTRDLVKKIGNIKGTFHPKMGTIKDRNGRDLVDTEEIKKRQKEYTEELYKKDHNELDNYDSMVSYPEPDILECEVKWTLGSTAVNKASGYDGISTELFKTLKDDAAKMLHSICQHIWIPKIKLR